MGNVEKNRQVNETYTLYLAHVHTSLMNLTLPWQQGSIHFPYQPDHAQLYSTLVVWFSIMNVLAPKPFDPTCFDTET